MHKINVKTVAENHPFVTKDGRRWASAKGAAMTVLTQASPAAAAALCPVVNERTKEQWSFDDCGAMWQGEGHRSWHCALPAVRGRMFGGAR